MYICSYGNKKGRCVGLLEKSHIVVNVTIFMSAVKYVHVGLETCRGMK